MQGLIERVWQEKQISMLLITHDVEEAIALADRVLVMY
jgi:sulfonate transport system ATP-binding protein